MGDPILLTDIEVKEDGSFYIDFGLTTLIGEANPITGTEIVATLTMKRVYPKRRPHVWARQRDVDGTRRKYT